jgi:hypothetical protein
MRCYRLRSFHNDGNGDDLFFWLYEIASVKVPLTKWALYRDAVFRGEYPSAPHAFYFKCHTFESWIEDPKSDTKMLVPIGDKIRAIS